MITFDRVSKAFGSQRVLVEVSFEVEQGEIFFVIGASPEGYGKRTAPIRQNIPCSFGDSREISCPTSLSSATPADSG